MQLLILYSKFLILSNISDDDETEMDGDFQRNKSRCFKKLIISLLRKEIQLSFTCILKTIGSHSRNDAICYIVLKLVKREWFSRRKFSNDANDFSLFRYKKYLLESPLGKWCGTTLYMPGP